MLNKSNLFENKLILLILLYHFFSFLFALRISFNFLLPSFFLFFINCYWNLSSLSFNFCSSSFPCKNNDWIIKNRWNYSIVPQNSFLIPFLRFFDSERVWFGQRPDEQPQRQILTLVLFSLFSFFFHFQTILHIVKSFLFEFGKSFSYTRFFTAIIALFYTLLQVLYICFEQTIQLNYPKSRLQSNPRPRLSCHVQQGAVFYCLQAQKASNPFLRQRKIVSLDL